MRTAPLAAVAVACAVIGGALTLGVGHLTGWTDSSSTTTVFRAAPIEPSTAATAAVGPAAKPLAGNGFSPSMIYARRSPGVVTIIAIYGSDPDSPRRAQGSGFVVSPQGYILTNSHVITTAGDTSVPQPADRVFVEFQDRDRAEATIIGWDVFDDVGLIKVDPPAHALAPVPLGNSAAVVVGEPVAAIGSPFGNENSLAVGVVSAVHRSIESLTSTFNLVDAIQTDAPINHGNSGGPLLDARGRVIGINSQIRSSGGGSVGVGYAVSVDMIRHSIGQIRADGKVRYAYVGITSQSLYPQLARKLGLPVDSGALISDVVDGGPGDKAGLQGGGKETRFQTSLVKTGGDVITKVNGRQITRRNDFSRQLERYTAGDKVSLEVYRGSRRRTVQVTLGER
ncbi:MAG: S1C family serine protease, partial [Gaiellaceae bacterium]